MFKPPLYSDKKKSKTMASGFTSKSNRTNKRRFKKFRKRKNRKTKRKFSVDVSTCDENTNVSDYGGIDKHKS